MTASENITTEVTPTAAAATPWHRALIFGTGFGIAISNSGNGDLEAVVVRSRPAESKVLSSIVIRDFASQPAAEWGAEVLRFLAADAGEPHLAATLVLPREEVIVRTVRLAGVAAKDTVSALELQLDTLHPWDDEPIEWAWWRVSAADVVVGIVRQSTLNHYETLFSEAGIPMAAATFSSAVVYAALRLRHSGPASIFCYMSPAPGRIEVYGESEAKPCYSAGFALSPERALSVARAELRLPPDHAVLELSEALDVQNTDVSPLAWAAALAASAPLAVRFANLLPAARRASHSRTQYLLPATLLVLAALGLLIVFVLFPLINERRYVRDLTAEQKADRARRAPRAGNR